MVFELFFYCVTGQPKNWYALFPNLATPVTLKQLIPVHNAPISGHPGDGGGGGEGVVPRNPCTFA